jgi:hypothetical protein
VLKLKMVIEWSIVLVFLVMVMGSCGIVAKNAWDGMWAGNCDEKTNMHAAMKREKKPQATIDYAYNLMVEACSKK